MTMIHRVAIDLSENFSFMKDSELITYAIKMGHVETAKYLYINGYVSDEDLIAYSLKHDRKN